MTPYCDLGFLLILIAKGRWNARAWRLAQRFEAPLPLNGLHQSHVENALARQLYDPKAQFREAAAVALAEWTNRLAEGVFELSEPPWEAAFKLAIAWNHGAHGRPPQSPFLLHPALAAASGATHFLSFDARSRMFAAAAGINLLPQSL